MHEAVLNVFAWNLRYAEALVSDLSQEDATTPGGPGLENHPAWTLGHLVTGANLQAQELGLDDDLPDGWADVFQRRGPGDPRLPDEEAEYPSLDALLAELRRQHERVADAWRRRTDEEWAVTEDWAFGKDLPSAADS
ncbi:MAG: DinB family protein, partial [Planctomycetota bacterium]